MSEESKGQSAERILTDEVFQEAVEGAKARLKDEWAAAESRDIRESLWHQLKALDAVPRELRSIRDRGVMHRSDREKREKRT